MHAHQSRSARAPKGAIILLAGAHIQLASAEDAYRVKADHPRLISPAAQ